MKFLDLIVKPIYAITSGGSGGSSDGTTIDIGTPENTISSLGNLISGLVTASIIVGALTAFLYLILGGFQWITSGGDKGKTEEAQKKITNAVIGLVIVAAAYAIISVVVTFLGIGSIDALVIPAIKK